MGGYLARRLAASAVTAFVASIAVFLIVRAVPGDVVAQMLGQVSDPQAAASLRGFLGLDQPVWIQYGRWISAVFSGDLGTSWTGGRPVGPAVFEAFLVTLEIGLLTLALATIVGVPLGIVSGIYEGRWPDNLIQIFNLLGLAAPVFWTGLMLLVAVSSFAGWSPPLIYASPAESLWDNLSILMLPILSLGLLQAAAYSQFVRQNVVTSLNQDYVRTARAKGVTIRILFFTHILKNILIPLITFMGLVLVQILGGVVIVETLFSIPGLGRLLISAIETRDYPMLQGALLVVVVTAMAVNLIIDLLYSVIDPRVRLS
ncbi:ABC transporter permease [Chelatococcus asaccharovorans]|uniref:ABC transporter permease n=1 Tax=Chelatococcus asaccharovorans TaxID=28210 RepID=UPI00224C668F|nr:ABC transporter permease [Chelatococcus asaccharovorans]CAH1653979.1 Peptide/nickel transport system permease protein [Chelatococcus asaccharovorans]CAH1694433.1 Peptide/nickel transport system permease protein [Chelatococcus asaccharovorans]